METTKTLLWDDDYLQLFAREALLPLSQSCFWEYDPKSQEVKDLKNSNIRKMLMRFYPALGVYNHLLGRNSKGLETTQLIFHRHNRCELLDVKTLEVITNRLFHFMGHIGDELRGHLHFKKSQVFRDDAVGTIPYFRESEPFMDCRDTAYRFFQNGWIEITKSGVSQLKHYEHIPQNKFVWNSTVIPRDYEERESLEVLERELQGIIADGINPETGEYFQGDERGKNSKGKLRKRYQDEWNKKIENFKHKVSPTHFRDFVQNLALDDDNNVDTKSLERIELAIGYLCHRFHIQSARKYICLVDRFYDANPEESNGGNGKSLLINSLSGVMNLTNLNGKAFKKGKENTHAFAPVTPTTEIVHFDDAHQKFDTEALFALTTGDFHIQRKYANPFSIPSEKAPKIVVTSNHPFADDGGHSFRRREFIVEIGNFYRIQNQLYQHTPASLHGHKHFPSASGDSEWDSGDWSEYYRYVFECVGKYLATDGLPNGGESEYYKRAKMLELLGSQELLDYYLDKLDTYSSTNEEVFVEVFYKDVKHSFPDLDVSNKVIWKGFSEVGKSFGKVPNRFDDGKLKDQRLTDQRLKKWNDQGMKDWVNANGRTMKKNDKVQTFKVTDNGDPVSFYKNSSNKIVSNTIAKPTAKK